MKWTSEQIEDLKKMCFEEDADMRKPSNAEIAKHFGVPVVEIHAKRSQLGITMPKVAALKGKPAIAVNQEFEAAIVEAEKGLPVKSDKEYNEERFARMRELNAKLDLIKLLEPAIIKADKSIIGLELLDQGSAVNIVYESGHRVRVDVEGDSLLAIIADVTRKCLF